MLFTRPLSKDGVVVMYPNFADYKQ